MAIIGLVNTDDGSNKTLEDALGLFSIATSGAPAIFEPTVERGAIAVLPSVLPSNPITGTLAVDISAGNMLKWWDGDEWVSCYSQVISGGGGGSGIGAGQTINLQQGLPANITIATSGPLQSIVANDPLPQGLFLNESTGQITGTPEVFGNYSISMTATFTDSTVATDDVGFSIAEAFPVTFTFDETQLANIPEGIYVNNLEYTYTPYPNALPITWDVQGLPNGMGWQQSWNDPNGIIIYGEPYNTGIYSVTVTATNWAGTTTQTFDITVFAYNMQVNGTISYDGLYVSVDTGYYTYNSGNVQQEYGQPSSWGYPVRVYEYDDGFGNVRRLFFFDPYASWVIEDVNNISSPFAPTYVRPMGNSYNSYTLPSTDGWFDPNPYSSVTITYVEP